MRIRYHRTNRRKKDSILVLLTMVRSIRTKSGVRFNLYPTLTATEEIAADTPRRNMKIKLKAIRFRSDQKLRNSIGLIKVKQLKKNFHSAKLSEVEIDMLLKGYFSTHQMMQRSDFQALCGMLRSTAMIHIRRICREGKLQNIGLRNQPIYVPVPGFYGTSRDQPTLR